MHLDNSVVGLAGYSTKQRGDQTHAAVGLVGHRTKQPGDKKHAAFHDDTAAVCTQQAPLMKRVYFNLNDNIFLNK